MLTTSSMINNQQHRQSTKSKKSSFNRKDDCYINILSQNVRGFNSTDKIEETINIMLDRNIDIFLLQETHTIHQNNNNDFSIQGYRIFLHGSSEDNHHLKGGVGIILSPQAIIAWKKAAIPPTLGKTIAGAARFMSIKLLVEHEKKEQFITFVSSYHPHSGYSADDLTQFFKVYDDFIQNINPNNTKNHHTIIGCDANTSIGIATNNHEKRILGTNGFNVRRNDQLESEIKDIMLQHNLRSSSSDFRHHRYDTFLGHGISSGNHQIDYIFVSNSIKPQIMDTKRTSKGIDSDHVAIKSRIRFKTKKQFTKNKNIKKHNLIQWSKLNDKLEAENFSKKVSEIISTPNADSSFPTLNEAIINAATEICPGSTKRQCDWFTKSKDVLLPMINNRNLAFKKWIEVPNDSNKLLLSSIRKQLRLLIIEAKNNWVDEIVSNLNIAENNNKARDVWSAIKKINEGLTGHHTKPIDMVFEKADGTTAINDLENINLITDHFQNVFNNNTNHVDIPDVINDLGPTRPTVQEMGVAPTTEEVTDALKRMKGYKAPGPLGIPAEALKALNDIALDKLHDMINKIFQDPDYIPEEWYEVNLKCLHKKGPRKNPSNWRGICLKEPLAKLLSSIINQRLLKLFSSVGTDHQYGCQPNKGCTDGLYVLRSLLQTRRHHNQESWVLFIDIVKAFDSVSHELLFALLLHYGTPPNIINIIKALYTGTKVNIKLGKESTSVPYTVGVQQGDNMAPTLFLFTMLAFSDLIDKHWTDTWNLKPLQFNFFDRLKGRLLAQNVARKGKMFSIPYLLYVDDGVFVFEDLEEISKGSQHIYDTFKRLGLIMHVGTDNNQSKSEALFISRSIKEDNNSLPDSIIINEGTIKFCQQFKYLGSIVSNDLKDETEIKARIKKANGQFGALKNVLLGKTLRLKTKINLFNAIVINTALWGCESWSLSCASKQQLEYFQHKSLRRILKISIYEVAEHHIKNASIRHHALNSPHIIDQINARQLIWLGKIAKMNVNEIPRKMLACWTGNSRKPGRPQLNARNSFVDSINRIVPNLPQNCELNTWLPVIAQKNWPNTVSKWLSIVSNIDLA